MTSLSADRRAAPVDSTDRIRDIDVIRGFALFGVIWMNMAVTTAQFMPAQLQAQHPATLADRVTSFLGDWLIAGKAQCLFGILFGVGFALFTGRLARRRPDAGLVYARRLLFLLGLGILHMFFLWWGDILHDYASVGFLLLLTPWLSDRALLATGLSLLLLLSPAIDLGLLLLSHPETSRHAAQAASHASLWRAMAQGNYPALVHSAVGRAVQFYGNLHAVADDGYYAGQFFLGAWVFRKGWLQNTAQHAALFRRAAAMALPAGLALTLIAPSLAAMGIKVTGASAILRLAVENLGILVLALAYASLLVLACRRFPSSLLLTATACFGRVALTNYVGQSLFMLFVYDGFGLGLMQSNRAAANLALAVLCAGAQMAFSMAWLRAFRFGPLEWVWRCATYAQWQPLRR